MGFSIIVHFIDGSSNDFPKYIPYIFLCPLTNILNTEALFLKGRQVFVLPLGGFLLIIYFLGRLSRTFFYISITQSSPEVSAKFLF